MRIIIIQLSGFRFLKCKSLNSLSTDFVNYGNDSNFVCSLAIVFLFINKLCQTSVAGSDLLLGEGEDGEICKEKNY